MRIRKIYVAEDIPDKDWGKDKKKIDYKLLNTDVIVNLDDGNAYRANFITLEKLIKELKNHRGAVGGQAKKYFWSRSMVIVNDVGKKELEPLIEYMIAEGDFQMIFEKL